MALESTQPPIRWLLGL
jgi:hypothetical protein